MATATALADSSSDTAWMMKALKQSPPPNPLPNGWILKSSRSQPGNSYYYHQETGASQWTRPIEYKVQSPVKKHPVSNNPKPNAATASMAKGNLSSTSANNNNNNNKHKALHDSSSSSNKKAKRSAAPKEVRVLHILKKHKDSRRPSSWRAPKITSTKEEATEELRQLLEILQESKEVSAEELRATFEELARTESDCSSAKRGGDLGFFGRKKMQPPFEHASFALDIGELSDIVETSSGVHVILRIG